MKESPKNYGQSQERKLSIGVEVFEKDGEIFFRFILPLKEVKELIQRNNESLGYGLLTSNLETLENLQPLTPNQLDLLRFLDEYIIQNGVAPRIEDIKEAANLSSKATIFEHLKKLEEKGWISREPRKTRSIKLTVGSKLFLDNLKNQS